MDVLVCPLCQKRVSNWEQASGKCTFIKGHLVHLACTKDYSVVELEKKLCPTK